MELSRRDFLLSSTAAAAAGTAIGVPSTAQARPTLVAQVSGLWPHGFVPDDPALKYELVVAGGEVIDPSQKLRARRDVGIKDQLPDPSIASQGVQAPRLRRFLTTRSGVPMSHHVMLGASATARAEEEALRIVREKSTVGAN
ncbi:MAG TPA: twin-arginine translocation signal domain-containing protein [Candidatus Methylomirabilis sp.]|nr:twin-arginine translocation signal domain-containing protein [Candidatus Methylomirabilis sp.]